MDDNDSGQNVALMAVALAVALVIALVLGIAVSQSRGGPAPQPAAVTAAAPALADDGPVMRLFFEVGSANLPADASGLLDVVATEARSTGLAVVVSGFHDASGDAAKNAELAKERALAVKHALEANGVAAERIMLLKPQKTTGGADPREARRVELRVR